MSVYDAAGIALLIVAAVLGLLAWAVRRADRNLDRHIQKALNVANPDDSDERDLQDETWTAHDETVYRKLTRWKRNEKK